jgi:hypothetical protein
MMPGKDRLQEIVKENVENARVWAENIGVAAKQPRGSTEKAVDDCAIHAHAAIDKAAEAAKVLVREG